MLVREMFLVGYWPRFSAVPGPPWARAGIRGFLNDPWGGGGWDETGAETAFGEMGSASPTGLQPTQHGGGPGGFQLRGENINFGTGRQQQRLPKNIPKASWAINNFVPQKGLWA